MKTEKTCVHFRGIQHKTCLADVDMLSVRVVPESGPFRWPCLPVFGRKDADVPCNCEKRRYPTPEEIEADRKMWDRAFAAVAAGKSPCCDAPLESRGTGRWCSKCSEFVARCCGSDDIREGA